jgi:MFS family permease
MSHLLKARIAVFIYFTLAGAAVTIWAVHIPQVETRLGITHAQTGSVLLLLGAGALVSMQLMGHLIDRVGSRTATVLGATVIGVAILFPGQAESLLTLAISIFFLGVGIGATDIAMNAHALEVEKAYGRPIFSAFHAMWSLGGLIGAAVGGLALSFGLEMWVTLSIWGGITILLAMAFNTWLLPNAPSHASSEQGASKSEGKAIRAQQNLANRKVVGLVIFLGLLSASAAIVEGVGVDWSALHQVRVWEPLNLLAPGPS